MIELCNLKVGDNVLFQMSHWSVNNWHDVTIKYTGSKYVVMHSNKRSVNNWHDVTIKYTGSKYVVMHSNKRNEEHCVDVLNISKMPFPTFKAK